MESNVFYPSFIAQSMRKLLSLYCSLFAKPLYWHFILKGLKRIMIANYNKLLTMAINVLRGQLKGQCNGRKPFNLVYYFTDLINVYFRFCSVY